MNQEGNAEEEEATGRQAEQIALLSSFAIQPWT